MAGYNPLHYIPYRTYNRLLKENSQANKSPQHADESIKAVQESAGKKSDTNVATNCLGKIKDLTYLDVVGKKTEIRGSSLESAVSKTNSLISIYQTRITT